jgi:hypothetical protein
MHECSNLKGAVGVAGEDVVVEVNDRRDLAVRAAVYLIDLLVAPHVLQWEKSRGII